MPIIAVLNPKGGSTKTTVSTNLAQAILNRQHSVLLVDSDPQGSARDWHAANEENPIPLVALDRANNMRTLTTMAQKYDYIIIDGAAKLEDMVAAAIKISDTILIPVQPSPYDIWGAADLVSLIQARREVTDGIPQAAFVITRAIQGTRLGREIHEALHEYGLPVLKTVIAQRQVYPQTSAEGLTVFNSGNVKATSEITEVLEELLRMMG